MPLQPDLSAEGTYDFEVLAFDFNGDDIEVLDVWISDVDGAGEPAEPRPPWIEAYSHTWIPDNGSGESKLTIAWAIPPHLLPTQSAVYTISVTVSDALHVVTGTFTINIGYPDPAEGYSLWFLADDVAELEADGAAVATWEDRTGSWTATHVEGNVPTVQHNEESGKACIRLAGGKMNLEALALQPMGQANSAYFAVVKCRKTGSLRSTAVEAYWGNGINYGLGGYFNTSPSDVIFQKVGSQNKRISLPSSAANAELLVLAGRNNADNTVDFWVGGTYIGRFEQQYSAGTPNGSHFGDTFMNNSGPGYFDLFEVVVYDQLLDDAQMHQTLSYLCDRYGVDYARIDTHEDFIEAAGEKLMVFSRADLITGYADTDPVTAIEDLSAYGHDMSIRAGGDPPIYHTNRINGLPALQMNATAFQGLIAPGSAIPAVEDAIYVCVGFKKVGFASSDPHHLINGGFTMWTDKFGSSSTSNYVTWNAGGNNIQSIRTLTDKAAVIGGLYDPSLPVHDGLFYLETDGGLPSGSIGNIGGRSAPTAELAIGHRYVELVGIDRYWDGDLFGWAVLKNAPIALRMAAHVHVMGDYVQTIP